MPSISSNVESDTVEGLLSMSTGQKHESQLPKAAVGRWIRQKVARQPGSNQLLHFTSDGRNNLYFLPSSFSLLHSSIQQHHHHQRQEDIVNGSIPVIPTLAIGPFELQPVPHPAPNSPKVVPQIRPVKKSRSFYLISDMGCRKPHGVENLTKTSNPSHIPTLKRILIVDESSTASTL
ncbi:hypothetical protein LZ30DRAFT_291395 [Colletotrichum cereale]|nr:hypothetical protein LZ30DRAFT_291395 [Colletotrichum cereale]